MEENDTNIPKSSNNVTAEDLGVDEIVYDAINVDVIGFGALNVDKLYKVGHIAEIDGESFIKGEEESPGGSAANTLIYADSGNSGKVLGFVSDAGDRALYVDPGVNDEITIDEINPLNVNACKILHYTSFVGDSFNAQKELLNLLTDKIVLSFDPGMLYAKKGVEELKEILERTDILLINESELGILFEDYYKEKLDLSDDKELSFRDLAVNVRNDGIDTVVVKRGSIGAYAINKKDEEVKIPAFECDAVDTTAAGDSFNAGFLYSYLKGYDLAKSCTIANWVASKSVQAIGISGLPTLEELEEFTQSL